MSPGRDSNPLSSGKESKTLTPGIRDDTEVLCSLDANTDGVVWLEMFHGKF